MPAWSTQWALGQSGPHCEILSPPQSWLTLIGRLCSFLSCRTIDSLPNSFLNQFLFLRFFFLKHNISLVCFVLISWLIFPWTIIAIYIFEEAFLTLLSSRKYFKMFTIFTEVLQKFLKINRQHKNLLLVDVKILIFFVI